MNRTMIGMLAAAMGITLAGCATNDSASVYEHGQTQREMTVRMGVVESVRPVVIAGSKSAVGTGAGAIIGGIAGSKVGQGRGSDVGAVLGAVVGGIAGSAVEEKTTRKNGLEITIRLESGGLIAVTQEADEQFNPGDRVRIVSGGGTTRVSH